MEHTPGVWTEELEIRASMVNPTRRASLTAIANFLQEVAGGHANFRRIGFYEMLASNRFWALTRFRVRMNRFPDWQERIRIQTWVSSMRGPFSTRNFLLLDKADQQIGAASTLWTAVDSQKRRPVRIDSEDFPVFPDRPPLCGEPDKLPEPAHSESPQPYRVRYSDLDMIHHVNNVQYLQWILDSYTEWPAGSTPVALDINYLGETHLGDQLAIHTQPLGQGQFLHSIFREGSGKEVVRAKIGWADQ